MPWFVTFTLILFAPLVLISWYVGRKLLNATGIVFGWERKKTKTAIILSYVFLHLLPIGFIVLFFIGGRAATAAFTGEDWILDVLKSPRCIKPHCACFEYPVDAVLLDDRLPNFSVRNRPLRVPDAVRIERVAAFDRPDVRHDDLDDKKKEYDRCDEKIDDCVRPRADDAILGEQKEVYLYGKEKDDAKDTRPDDLRNKHAAHVLRDHIRLHNDLFF